MILPSLSYKNVLLLSKRLANERDPLLIPSVQQAYYNSSLLSRRQYECHQSIANCIVCVRSIKWLGKSITAAGREKSRQDFPETLKCTLLVPFAANCLNPAKFISSIEREILFSQFISQFPNESFRKDTGNSSMANFG